MTDPAALAGVTPLAGLPPITIGELTDVPAPGSPIASAWSQEVTNRIVHRFANGATRDAQFTNRQTGTLAYTLDTGRLCLWDGVGWLILREAYTQVPAGSPLSSTKWPHSNGSTSTSIWQPSSGWTSGWTVRAMYMRANGRCFIELEFACTGTTGIGMFNLPFPALAPEPIDNQFQVAMLSSGNDYFAGWSVASGTIGLFGVGVSGTAVKRQPTAANFPFTWKANDTISVVGTYTLFNGYDVFYMNP